MDRKRVIVRWAKVAKIDIGKLTQRTDDHLQYEEELSKADMRRWMLRECDEPDYQYWMPHLVVPLGQIVRVYYTWVGPDPIRNDLVLVIAAGKCVINEWENGKLKSSKAASLARESSTPPSAKDTVEIAQYVSQWSKKDQDK